MRIERYPKDKVITANDMVIGTDGDNKNKTKNFPIWQLSQLILGQLKNSGMVLRYSNGTDPNTQIGSEGYFFTDNNTISKNQVATFYFSETTLFGENLSALLNSVGSNLGDLYIGITQQDDAANYGFFNILALERIDNYYKLDVQVRGTLFAKTFNTEKNYALLFDLASNEFSIDAVGSDINIYKNGVLVDTATLTINPDDINLSRLVNGVVDDNGIATFVRDDETTFAMDFSGFLGSIIPKRTSDLINDGEGTGAPFVTDAYDKAVIDSKDAFIQGQVSNNAQDVSVLQGLNISVDEVNQKIILTDGNNEVLAEAPVNFLNNEGVRMEYDAVGKTLKLISEQGVILDTIPISSFISNLASDLQFNGIDKNRLELIGNTGAVVGSVEFQITNISGLTAALASKEISFSKYTAFNKDFGNTAGTVAEGSELARVENLIPTDNTHLPNAAEYITADDLPVDDDDVIGKPIYIPRSQLNYVDKTGVMQWLNTNGFSKIDKEFIVIEVQDDTIIITNGYVTSGYVTSGYVLHYKTTNGYVGENYVLSGYVSTN